MTPLRSIHSEEQLLTRTELADLLGVHPDTLDKMRKDGLPEIRWGRRLLRFRASAALQWLEENE